MTHRSCDLDRWSELLVFFAGREALHAYLDASGREAMAIFDHIDSAVGTSACDQPLLRDRLHALRGIAATLGFVTFNRQLDLATGALASEGVTALHLHVATLRQAFQLDLASLHAWRSVLPPDCDCGH